MVVMVGEDIFLVSVSQALKTTGVTMPNRLPFGLNLLSTNLGSLDHPYNQAKRDSTFDVIGAN